jgi:polyisoprenoid-binding protein YceI
MKKFSSFPMVAAAVLAVSSARAEEVVYAIDPVHSVVLLKVDHLGLADAYGRFNEMFGEVRYNEADPEKSSMNFEVKADSIDTANEDRDKHLRGPDFFNAAEFPALTFKSTKVEKKGEKEFAVTGDFTVRGTTKPVTFDFELGGTGKGMQGEDRFGGGADFTVKRSDFGIDYLPQALGDDVEVIVSLEGIKQ